MKTAVVTGASRGIGAAIARRLAEEGYAVHALARSADALNSLQSGTGIRGVPVDVTDTAALAAVLAPLEVEVLINCAGLVEAMGPVQSLSNETVDRILAVNLGAAIHATRICLTGMRGRGRGSIINIGSLAGLYPFPDMAVYAAAKAGLHHFTRCLRLDLVGSGIRVTEIALGRVRTDIYVGTTGESPEAVRTRLYARHTPLLPVDVAEAVMGVLRAPAHVNPGLIELVPTDQAVGGMRYEERQPTPGRKEQ